MQHKQIKLSVNYYKEKDKLIELDREWFNIPTLTIYAGDERFDVHDYVQYRNLELYLEEKIEIAYSQMYLEYYENSNL